MTKLSLNELGLISKSRGIKFMSEDRFLSALNASESIRNKDYDADEILKKETIPDPKKYTKLLKT